MGGGNAGQRTKGFLLAEQARAGAQHIAPKLVLPFISPEQIIDERGPKIGDDLTCRAAIFADPRMAEFMRQQISAAGAAVPIGKIFWIDAVLGRPMVLEANASQLICQRQQKIIMIIGVMPKSLIA